MTHVHVMSVYPALDKDVVEGKDIVQAGGKGANVTDAMHELGVRNVTLYALVGGNNGRIFESLAQEVGYNFVGIPMEAETRLVVAEHRNPDDDEPEVRIDSHTPVVREREICKLRDCIYDNARAGDIVRLSGSISQERDWGLYGEMIRYFNSRNVLTTVDTSTTEALRLSAVARPSTIQCNLHEFRVAFERDHPRRVMEEYGLPRLLITKGRHGMDYYEGDKHWEVVVPTVSSVSSVGSGDVTGGVKLKMLLDGAPIKEQLRSAAAAGTASVMCNGTGGVDVAGIQAIIEQVQVNLVNGNKPVPLAGITEYA